MSASLIKKGLKLFEDDLKPAVGSSKAKGNLKAAGAKSKSKEKRKQTTLKDRKVKSALQKFARKNIKEDRTAANLKVLEKLSNSKPVDSSIVEKILESQGRRHQKLPEKKTKETSVFTEEDFQKFEREYFVNVK